MEEGSWTDAKQSCVQLGGHLWSINSYSEWSNIINTLEAQYYYEGKVISSNFLRVFTTTLLFIGLNYAQNVSVQPGSWTLFTCFLCLSSGSGRLIDVLKLTKNLFLVV